MDTDTLRFFEGKTEALPLYEKLEEEILSQIDDVRIKTQKSQISFYRKHLFACVSFARVRKKKDCPAQYIVVTFGLDHKVESPRIDIATEPYPNRWTHHVLISESDQIDAGSSGFCRRQISRIPRSHHAACRPREGGQTAGAAAGQALPHRRPYFCAKKRMADRQAAASKGMSGPDAGKVFSGKIDK